MPPNGELETNAVLKQLARTNRTLAELKGYELVKAREMFSTNMIVDIQNIIEKNSAGIRKLTGTVLRNEKTGEIVYTPPAGETEIR